MELKNSTGLSHNVYIGTRFHLFPSDPGKDAVQGPPKLFEEQREHSSSFDDNFGGPRTASFPEIPRKRWNLNVMPQFCCSSQTVASWEYCFSRCHGLRTGGIWENSTPKMPRFLLILEKMPSSYKEQNRQNWGIMSTTCTYMHIHYQKIG